MEGKMTFDLGQAFTNLCNYLTTKDKLQLSSTSRLMREVVFKNENWQEFQITDYQITKWEEYLKWLTKYMPIIKPSMININLSDNEHEQDKQLLALFIYPQPHVQELTLRINSNFLHLLLANSCTELVRLSFHSADVSDQLIESMFKYLNQVSQLQVNADALGFTAKGLATYLKNPLEKLILKPYQLDYDSLLELVEDPNLNQLAELEIDVQECQPSTLIAIISHLRHVRRLRLYHLQNFEDATTLAAQLGPLISELTLTKGYQLDMDIIIKAISSPTLISLDLTEAVKLQDAEIYVLAENSINLKELNISWCNDVGSEAVKMLIRRCVKLQKLVLNGLKSLDDFAFQEYEPYKSSFKQKYYDEMKYEIRKSHKVDKHLKEAEIYSQFQKRVSNAELFEGQIHEVVTLRNLRLLDCNSCNKVSDQILKIIYSFNRMAQVINYYGEDLGLFRNSFAEEDFD